MLLNNNATAPATTGDATDVPLSLVQLDVSPTPTEGPLMSVPGTTTSGLTRPWYCMYTTMWVWVRGCGLESVG